MKYLQVFNWNYDLQLTQHFKLGELICSDVAYANRIYMQYVFSKDIQEALYFLANNLLEPIRKELGRPIIVNSAYRCTALNNLVGGAKNSCHLRGYAADITSPAANEEIVQIAKHLKYHELLRYDNFVHVSLKPDMNEFRCIDFRKHSL